ncbi:MAG TPA: glycoside hydrolase family 43 protein [Ktedonobacteraceae bacterium]
MVTRTSTKAGRWKLTLGLLTLCFLAGACASPSAAMPETPTLQNPISTYADPFIVLYNSTYYLTGTDTGTSIEIQYSPRLENVSDNTTTVWDPLPDEPQYQVWSPSMFLLDYQGKRSWFIYFTASSDNTNEAHRIYVLQSSGTDPLGPYTFKGQLGGTDQTTAIDPSLLHLNGKLYMMYVLENGSNATYIAPMSDPLTISGPPQLLINPDQPWEMGEGVGSNYPVAEGPEALYHNGKTFIVYSGSNTGNYNYCRGLLTYDGTGDPLQQSSWTKTGPVFQYSRANGVFGPGRATFTTSPDGKQDWMVYHAKITDDFTADGRETRAQEFTWNAGGTPNFGVPVSISTKLTPPSGEKAK